MVKAKKTINKTFYEQLQALVHQGNINFVVLINKQGQQSIKLPITLVVILTIFLTPLMALGLILYLLSGHTIELEK